MRKEDLLIDKRKERVLAGKDSKMYDMLQKSQVPNTYSTGALGFILPHIVLHGIHGNTIINMSTKI